jgi:pyruvate dehydrogenase E2 component (dihydrolipoamide acetyltransferase)
MADAKEVTVPDIGDFSDVPVIEILVKPGDEVAADGPLVTLESDKATMDVPAPFAGTVTELRVEVGDEVSEGTVIALVEPAESGAISTQEAPVESAVLAEEQEDDGTGEAAEGEPEGEDQEQGQEEESEEEPAPEPAREAKDGASGLIYASPSVRRIARELGVDVSRLRGTGRKGRITKEDVKAALTSDGGGGGGIPGLEVAPWPEVDFEKYGEVKRVPLSRIKRISGPNLARNWVMIPHVTHEDEADITELEAFRKQVNEEQHEAKVTMVALLIKACVGALRQFPEFNSSLDGDELVIKRYYHIGFAADTPQGLLVPVIRDADRKGLIEIARELTELSGKAREGKISAEEMRGSTFTISSLGGIGGTGFTPIVNAPEVAILGVTRARMRPVWTGEEFEPRLVVPLSLSYDHRVIDGAAAARFVAHLATELSDLRRVLL